MDVDDDEKHTLQVGNLIRTASHSSLNVTILTRIHVNLHDVASLETLHS